MPTNMVMLKTENNLIAKIGNGSVVEAKTYVDFPDISNRGVIVDFGNNVDSTLRKLLPIKNK